MASATLLSVREPVTESVQTVTLTPHQRSSPNPVTVNVAVHTLTVTRKIFLTKSKRIRFSIRDEAEGHKPPSAILRLEKDPLPFHVNQPHGALVSLKKSILRECKMDVRWNLSL